MVNSPGRVAARFLRSSTVTAYHVGSMKPGQRFTSEFMGGGEGNLLLGPGVYFSTDLKTSLIYAKYARPAYLHTVTLDTKGYYDPTWGTPKPLREALSSCIQALVGGGVIPQGFADRGSSSDLKYGRGYIGVLHEALGAKKALRAFRDLGITGTLEKLSDSTEYAVFDMSTIRLIESKAL